MRLETADNRQIKKYDIELLQIFDELKELLEIVWSFMNTNNTTSKIINKEIFKEDETKSVVFQSKYQNGTAINTIIFHQKYLLNIKIWGPDDKYSTIFEFQVDDERLLIIKRSIKGKMRNEGYLIDDAEKWIAHLNTIRDILLKLKLYYS